jgi:hypothetical protein
MAIFEYDKTFIQDEWLDLIYGKWDYEKTIDLEEGKDYEIIQPKQITNGNDEATT